MLRYWKLALLVPCIVLTIGAYYAVAAVSKAQYTLTTLMGDESAVEPVSLEASVYADQVNITPAGTSYRSEHPFWKNLDEAYYGSQPRLKELIRDHRNFMRGITNLNGMVVEENRLAYAEIEFEKTVTPSQVTTLFQLHISIWDKGTKKKTSLVIPVDDKVDFDHINLHDVQLQGQEISLLTSYYVKADEGKPVIEFKRYIVDLDKKQLVKDRSILSRVVNGVGSLEFTLMNEIDPTQPRRHVVFQKTETHDDPSTGQRVTDNREVFVYDLETDTLQQILTDPLAEQLKSKTDLGMSSSAEEIFFTSWAEPNAPRVMRYHLEEKKVTHDYKISLEGLPLRAAAIDQGVISDNRIYLLLNGKRQLNEPPGVVVADLDSGKVVYEGTVTRTENGKLDRLYVFDLEVN
ncbi:hypothetical protein ACVNS2_14305 [Paenibacillus caseinilyticus]|uniref:Uncharacterized protein n=1 Tax=Paenibacillus mucilaginosus K02 TaxID=997761 RepID=I0BHG4_9BACL|nr:hypothetical protein [Paenibacillus mucilaginosus]AFH61811.1 hypothetical protein B2K_13985 [Paenibacillus mucilaginosus K02]AFK65240.1 hypothetical protein [Paenibacillus mucilaginosus K02]